MSMYCVHTDTLYSIVSMSVVLHSQVFFEVLKPV